MPAAKAPDDALERDISQEFEKLARPPEQRHSPPPPQASQRQHIQPEIKANTPRETPRGRDMMVLSPETVTPEAQPGNQYSQRHTGDGYGQGGSPMTSPMNLNVTDIQGSPSPIAKSKGKPSSVISGGAASLLSAAPLLPPGWAMCSSCENPVKMEWGSCPKCGTDVGDDLTYSTDTGQ